MVVDFLNSKLATLIFIIDPNQGVLLKIWNSASDTSLATGFEFDLRDEVPPFHLFVVC